MGKKGISTKKPTEKPVIETPVEPGSALEKLKQLEEEKKKLRKQIAEEKKTKKTEKSKAKEERNLKLLAVEDKLDYVQQKIYAYNKLGKADKSKSDIFNEIRKIVEDPIAEPQTVEA